MKRITALFLALFLFAGVAYSDDYYPPSDPPAPPVLAPLVNAIGRAVVRFCVQFERTYDYGGIDLLWWVRR